MRFDCHFRILVWVLVATTASLCLSLVARDGEHMMGKNGLSQPVPYTVLYDEMEFIIRIEVKAEVNEEQLRATLVKAANEHQDDAARDYLMMEHLLVEAYIEREGRVSSIPAGRLRRYVPPRNPESRDATRTDQDSFTITLDEAKRTLP